MISSGAIDAAWLVTGFLLAAWFYGQWLRPWSCLLADLRAQWPALLIATLALVVLWHIRATVTYGLSLHLLGAMLCTLVFGPRLALFPLTIALVSAMVSSGADAVTLGLNATLLVLWPIGLSLVVARYVTRLPANIFIFIFVGGFFGSAAVVVLTGWLLSLVTWATQIIPWGALLEDYAMYWMLVGFSEAWLTGMLLTVMVVYRPDGVRMFDAARYIDNA
jgi:uncharacterized membrane protein